MSRSPGISDIARPLNPVQRDPIQALVGNLRRQGERQILEELGAIRIERLPESEIKEQLLDLRSRARKRIDEGLRV